MSIAKSHKYYPRVTHPLNSPKAQVKLKHEETLTTLKDLKVRN